MEFKFFMPWAYESLLVEKLTKLKTLENNFYWHLFMETRIIQEVT